SFINNLSLENVIITNNFADWGGGIYCYYSGLSLENVTIIGNSADYGGGIYCADNSNPNLINSILWNNNPQEIYFHYQYSPSSVTISYSDIQGGEEGIETNDNGIINWLEGNIDANPLFADTLYHLSSNSPCIDAGIPDTTGLNLPPFDLDNNFRVWDGDNNGIAIIDMGTFEYDAPPFVSVNGEIVTNPSSSALFQNYPNPFNSSTTISFELTAKDAKNAKIEIYNIKGQKLKTLDVILSGAEGTTIWNGNNDSGKLVGSGIYFYKLKVNGKPEQIRKCILLR
ncbi:MAG: hypothetical protein B6D62_02690, partial [Candidatus Cloacimonas sp. 4484_275]